MLRTAGAPACDSLGRVHSRTDDEFLRAVAAAVDSDDKVLRFAAFCLKGVLCAQLWRCNPVITKNRYKSCVVRCWSFRPTPRMFAKNYEPCVATMTMIEKFLIKS